MLHLLLVIQSISAVAFAGVGVPTDHRRDEIWVTEHFNGSELVSISFTAFEVYHLFPVKHADLNGLDDGEANIFVDLGEKGLLYVERLRAGVYNGEVWIDNEEYRLEDMSAYTKTNSDSCIIYPVKGLASESPDLFHSLAAVRQRRDRKEGTSIRRNRCPVHVVGDHFFFHTTARGNLADARRYIVSLIDRVNKIFTRTDFGKDSAGRSLINLGFVIKKIEVHEEPTHIENHYNNNNAKFYQNNYPLDWNLENILNSFSRVPDEFATDEEYRSLCLRLLITARPMKGNEKGKAFIGKSVDKGMCATRSSYNLLQQNTLVVLVNEYTSDGLRQSLVTTEVTLNLAHELGHAWGADHDEDEGCKHDSDSSYIMHWCKNSGFHENNWKFSKCSVDAMAKMLPEATDFCFQPQQSLSLCGNGIVEGEEECDEGTAYPSHAAPCCTNTCTLRPQADCSPLNDVCCTPSCTFASPAVQCMPDSSVPCRRASFCSGNSSSCPTGETLFDGTTCLHDGKCYNGTCFTFCQQRGKKDCACTQPPEAECRRCCSSPLDGECTADTDALSLPDGSLCHKGYCQQKTCVKSKATDLYRASMKATLTRSSRSSLGIFISDNFVTFTVVLVSLLFTPVVLAVYKHECNSAQERADERDAQGTPGYNHRSALPSYTPSNDRLIHQHNNSAFNGYIPLMGRSPVMSTV